MPNVSLALGDIEYEDTGGDGPVLVFLHGLVMNGSVWRHIVAGLRQDFRCVVPLLPVGAHRIAIAPDRTLSPSSVADMIVELIQTLDLRGPVLIETDGGRAQTVASRRPDLLGGLVLISCEAFDNYPPGLAGKVVKLAARVPGGLTLMLQAFRFRPLRRLPTAWGLMTKRPVPDAVMDGWMAPVLTDRAIRRDLRRYLLAARPSDMLDAVDELRRFERSSLVVWAREDRMMPLRHGERLARILPRGQLVVIDDAFTLISEDQPAKLLEVLAAFLAPLRHGAPPGS